MQKCLLFLRNVNMLINNQITQINLTTFTIYGLDITFYSLLLFFSNNITALKRKKECSVKTSLNGGKNAPKLFILMMIKCGS